MRISLTLLMLTLFSAVSSLWSPRADDNAEDTKTESKPKPFRLMTDERGQRFRALFPEVESDELSSILKAPETLLYSEREIPKAYQFWANNLPGLHAVSFNISAEPSEPFGNGNIEFPWGTPAGVHRSSGIETFKFLSLPKDESGNMLPVAWYPHHHRGDAQIGYAWVFPIGTVIGECLLMRSPSNEQVMFELRIRRRTQNDWEVDVFRPFPTSESLVSRIQELRPEWESEETTRKLVEHLNNENRLAKQHLSDQHPSVSFSQSMGVDVLPEIEDALALELLKTTPFQSSHSRRWAENENGIYSVAPTTRDSFHVIPANFDGGFIDVDETSCLRCHDTVAKNVRNFEPFRDWYGRIRGSDGIFSFHPFSPGSISHNGEGVPIHIRGEFLRAGIVAQFDPAKHPKTHYRRLSFLGE